MTDPDGCAVTLHFPGDAADAIAACGALVDAIETIRRAALGSLAEQVKADLPEDNHGYGRLGDGVAGRTGDPDEVDLPDATGYGRLGAAFARAAMEDRRHARIPEDAVCEDPDLGTWAPGELVEAYGS